MSHLLLFISNHQQLKSRYFSWLISRKKSPKKVLCKLSCIFATPEKGRQFIVVKKGRQGTLFMTISRLTVGSQRLLPGAVPGIKGKCLAPGQAGGLQKCILHTNQHVYLPLSFHSPHNALSLSSPAKSLVWYFDKTPACSTLLQKGLSSFNKDPFCRMILEKQGWANRGEAGPW